MQNVGPDERIYRPKKRIDEEDKEKCPFLQPDKPPEKAKQFPIRNHIVPSFFARIASQGGWPWPERLSAATQICIGSKRGRK